MKKNNFGFTLIELMIVLGIIGIILSLTVISLGNVKTNSRDMKRVSDVKQIQTALEMYRANEGNYPAEIITGTSLSSASTTYLTIVPANPASSDPTLCIGSDYTYTNNVSSYTLEFCLEKNSGLLEGGNHCATPIGTRAGTCY